MGPRREPPFSPVASALFSRAVSRSFRWHRGVRGFLPGDLRPNRHDRGTPPGGGAAARTFWVAFRRHGDHGQEQQKATEQSCSVAFYLGSGGGIRTPDLWVMSPTSCRCSTPRRALGDSRSVAARRVGVLRASGRRAVGPAACEGG